MEIIKVREQGSTGFLKTTAENQVAQLNPFQSELREQEMYIFEQMNFNRNNRITKHYYCINNEKREEV